MQGWDYDRNEGRFQRIEPCSLDRDVEDRAYSRLLQCRYADLAPELS